MSSYFFTVILWFPAFALHVCEKKIVVHTNTSIQVRSRSCNVVNQDGPLFSLRRGILAPFIKLLAVIHIANHISSPHYQRVQAWRKTMDYNFLTSSNCSVPAALPVLVFWMPRFSTYWACWVVQLTWWCMASSLNSAGHSGSRLKI